jgi:xanthine dehydrogenase YagR molybdenum-binding subunit
MDELAYIAGMDPLEFRLANYADKDEQKNKPYSNKNLRDCYKLGAERFGWAKRNPKPGMNRVGNKLIGHGMSTATYPVHAFPAKATAKLNADGTFLVRSGTQDIGTGTYTIMTQIAADTLGVPVEAVTFECGDSTFAPAGMSGGSTTAACVGSAVKSACEALLERLTEMSGGDKSKVSAATYKDILANAKLTEVEAPSKTEDDHSSKDYSMHSFGAHFCEVAVDTDTHEVRVTRWVSVIDGGIMFNHKTARSQIMGGVTMGIGMALLEESLVDLRYGRTMNADLAEYHVPVHADIPSIDVSFVEVPDYKANPLGGHGIGEIGITGVAGAVANAVFNATGVRVRELPITLDKLMQQA